MIEIRHVQSSAASTAAYDQIYHGSGIRHLDSYYIWLLNLLQPRPPGKLLDVSCGEGSLLRFAQRRGLQAHGVDIAAAALARAALAVPGLHLQVADAEKLPYRAATFDYVTCIGSIEHFEQPALGAQEIARVLKPAGRALILLPNTFGLWWNVQVVLKTGDVADDGQPIQRYGTRAQWARLLEGAGLAVDKVFKFDRVLPRTPADWGWYLRRPQKLLLAALVFPLIPTNLASCLVFRCVKGGAQTPSAPA